MSKHLPAAKTIELLENLRGTVRDFAAREEKLNQELRAKVAVLRHRRDTATGELTRQLSTETEQLNARFLARREKAAAAYERRKSIIRDAQKASKRQALQRIEHREGSRKHRLQTETLQSQRNRETGLANTEQAAADSQNALAAEQEKLALLEARARKSFNGYGKFLRFLSRARTEGQPALAQDESQLIQELRELIRKSDGDLRQFRRRLLPAVFRYRWVWLLLVLGQIPLVPLLGYLGIGSFSYAQAAGSVVGCLMVGFILHSIGKGQAEPAAAQIASALGRARRIHDACREKSQMRHRQELERIEKEFQSANQRISQEWNLTLDEAAAERASFPKRTDDKAARIAADNERLYRLKLERLGRDQPETLGRLKQDVQARVRQSAETCEAGESKLKTDYEALWRQLELEWKTKIEPLYKTFQAAQAEAEKLFPPWEAPRWENWTPPAQFSNAAKFAHVDVDVEVLSEGAPKDKRLALPGPPRFSVPLLLTYPDGGSVLFETTHSGRDDAIGALNNIVLRLLSTAPPGRLSFTVIDPVGLGQSFSGVMHLTDYAEHLINSRIWTQTGQIEQRLSDLNEHMEKVIQMYLRNEYATIAEYNEQAGNIAEKYHFVVVADFPVNFSDAAARRLLSIANSGARCGVFTLIHWDRRQTAPQDFVPDELRKSSVCITAKGNDFALTNQSLPGIGLELDAPPAPDFAIKFIQKVGVSSRDSNRVEVPFSHVAPSESEQWSLDTTSELRVPIGRTGATKLQYLAIGKGTRQHALLAGKTGSGKSTLFHVMITNLALWCPPEQVEFYLIDFKKGVEFKCYATHRLPQARVVAIESDRDFGLSVLQRVDEELKRRGEMFRRLGVQDVAGYKRAGGSEPIPRTLLIIDEFQEFFVEDDKIGQTASMLLDRIVRQGRAFGIHVLLGSQTLGGAYTVARTTLGQMVIRIALQCNEADAYLIMDDNNPAPRLLSRPGEAIYNDTAGTMEGNSPFQVVWLPDDVRDEYLARVRKMADRKPAAYPGPIVFEGNAPADVRDNSVLQGLLEAETVRPDPAARIWLGAPNSIKGPTQAVFHRQSGNNLIIVGQREEASLAIVSVGLVSLAAQYPLQRARFIVCDGNPAGTAQRDYLERIIRAVPHEITMVRQGDLPEMMKQLTKEMTERSEQANESEAPPTFLFIHGLQKFNKLRYEEDFGFSAGDEASANPATLLNNLICEGARLGFHVIATCDTYNNVTRYLSRKALSEFEMRVLYQMSANDSASLIDSPKAGALGLHRALFYNEQEGYLETFRPYALPANEWIDQAAAHLARLARST